MSDLLAHKILIIDFGSQFTQLIARRIRELNVYCEIMPYDIDSKAIRQFNPRGIILSGSPNSVYDSHELQAPKIIFELGIPVLGICYGMHYMAQAFNGQVEGSKTREFGYAEIYDCHSKLLRELGDDNSMDKSLLKVWMSHGDKVTKLPDGFSIIASSKSCQIAAMADEKRNLYAVQFHPEVTHTLQGVAIFKRFLFDICKCDHSWNMPDYSETLVKQIRAQVGNDKVILALSGGVDSTVAGVLIDKAIGKNLTCIFVDTGLLRLNEAEQVMHNYKESLGLNIIKINAQDRFFRELAGVRDPEQKRKIIGRLFIEVFQEEASKMTDVKWLAQGTIYPDVIESAGSKTKKAHNIKSHHNVGGLPESLHLQLLEPLRELFKDEVRKLGVSLGVPHKLVYRHPFPGPGLSIRVLGEVKEEYLLLLRHADAIFIQELENDGYYHKVSQAFATFLPVKTVGVMGDGRTYDYTIGLRAVETSDFMTANVANLPLEFITKVANRIINEVKGVNRVLYDVSGKPPATIEWE